MIKLVDILFEMYPPYKANMVKKTRYKASDTWTNDPDVIEELVTDTDVICDNCGWEWPIDKGGKDLYICHKCGHNNNPDLKEVSKRIPRKPGQPAGSDKHSDLYTDEDPKGTITGLGFKDAATARDGVSKINKAKRTHAHKVQATLVMKQRAKVAMERTKDPEKKKKLKAAYLIWSKKLEQLKAKTQKLKSNKTDLNEIEFKQFLSKLIPKPKEIIPKLKDFIKNLSKQGFEAKKAADLLILASRGDIKLSDIDKKLISNQFKDFFKTLGLVSTYTLPGGTLTRILLYLLKLESLITPSTFKKS